METTEHKLTEYLKTKYNPLAIVLHGSRANGMWREYSDWDIVIFTQEYERPISREIIFDANIEIKQIVLPVPDDKFLGFFFRSENTKILYDTEDLAKKLLLKNDAFVKKGNPFEQIDKMKRESFFISALGGIKDYADNDLILLDKKIDFYSRIAESWFRFTKQEFEPSHYYAYPTIQKEDPEFYALIEAFAAAQKSDELVETGNQIIKSLFK